MTAERPDSLTAIRCVTVWCVVAILGACFWAATGWRLAGPALAQSTATPTASAPAPKRVSIDVLTEKDTVAAGEAIWIALRERIEPGWHTYWSNPGDSGEPTTATWHLPTGFKAGPLQFPLPSSIPVGPLVNYGYSDEVLLLSRLQVPQDAAAGDVELKVDAEWLVCKDICIPERGEARLSLRVTAAGTGTPPGQYAPLLNAAVSALPKLAPWPVAFSASSDELTLSFKGLTIDGQRPVAVTFFPATWGKVDHAARQAAIWAGDDLTVILKRGDLKKEAIFGLAGILVADLGEGAERRRRGFAVTAGDGAAIASAASANSGAPRQTPAASPAPAVQAPGTVPNPGAIGILQALLFAVLGGLILNLMPCVFPVLSLKAVALTQADRSAKEGRADGIAYLAGVLVSFAVLAGFLFALRHAGQSLGWGFQFQSPIFVLLMAGLFFGLGLTMSGVVSFGETLTGAGDRFARKSGPAGAFFTGGLATVAATPCTAPFMGAAIGYALGAPVSSGLLVLLAMGLGFAAPVVALAWSPRLQRILPRPGRWMETFKQAMAFPLYASAGWMVWVLSLQSGSDGVLAAMVLLIGVAFLAWLWSRVKSGGRASFGGFALILAAAALVGMAAGLVETGADGKPGSATSGSPSELLQSDVTGLPIIPFSPQRIASLQQEGRPVFVNLTAAWCITCKVNERVALSSEKMRSAFTAAGVAYVKGDWTRQDPEITRFLQSFGRAGVPLYLIYPGRAGAPPRVLDQVLTEGHVLAAMKAATTVR